MKMRNTTEDIFILAVLGHTQSLWPCRLCLKTSDGVDSWSHLDRCLRIDSMKTTTTLRTIINTLWNTQICKDDALPQIICNSCVDSVIQCLLFRSQCAESEKRWTKLVNDLYKTTIALNTHLKSRTTTKEYENSAYILKGGEFRKVILTNRTINVERICKYLNEKEAENDFRSEYDYEPESTFELDYDVKIKKTKHKKTKKTKRKSTGTFTCMHCSQVFIQKDYLNTHLKLKHNIIHRVECNDCGRKFKSISLLRRHVFAHRTSNAYKCTECEKTFNLALELESHITETHNVPITNIQCPECPEKFCLITDVKKHQIKTHGSGHNHVCKHCGKKYQSLARLLNHNEKHKTAICHKCSQEFPYPQNPKINLERCVCSRNYTMSLENPGIITADENVQHHRTEHECKMCNRKFSSAARLNCHLSHHMGVVCEKCGRRFKYKSQLISHYNLCQKERKPGNPKIVKPSIGPPQFICDHCGKEFNFKESLKSHIKGQHLFHNTYKCDFCEKRFNYKGGLKSHLIVHTRERSHQCNICGKYFVTKPALVYHMRLHTGERPFPCELCDQKFLSASRRMAHVRTKHWGRTEECSLCSSKFYTPYALRKHMSRHYNPNSKLFCNKISDQIVEYNAL